MHTHSPMDDLLHLLGSLIREPSVVGVEDAFFRVLRREFEEFPITVRRYHGLLVAEGSKPDRMYLSAHVDRHGLLCTGPNEFQYAAFIAGNRSELTGDSVSEQFMDQIADRFVGKRVQAHTHYTGAYLGQGIITRSSVCPRRRNLLFELDGLEFLQPGTPVSFLDRLQVHSGVLSAQLDNVASVAMIIQLFRQGFQGTALLAAGEEAGRSWRYIVEWFQRYDFSTDRLIVLDTSPFPEADIANQQVALRHCDASATFNTQLTDEIRNRCDALKVSYTFKDEYVRTVSKTREKPLSLGRTELGRIINATQGSISGTTLQLPTTAYHTSRETASVHSYQAMLNLLSDLAQLNDAMSS
ncbi:MAG: peptidase M42 [Planctomycetaceae bacterium]